MDTGTVFAPTASVFPFQYHSTNAPESSLSVYMLLLPERERERERERAKAGNAKRSSAFSDTGEQWVEKSLKFLFVCKGL